VAGFELVEDFFGAGDDVFGEAGEAGDLDAVAFFGGAGEDLVEEDDLLVPLLHDVTRTEVEGFSRRGGFGGFRPRQIAHGKKAGNWGIPGMGGSGCPQSEAR
jgi:hypothetical protein